MNDEHAPPPADDGGQDLIGKQLRQLYESVLNEPIPDSIVDLLVRLDDVTAQAPPHTRDSPQGDAPGLPSTGNDAGGDQ